MEVSVNGGSWQKINLDSFTWESGGWTHYRADLSAHAGSNIQIAFHFRSNSGGNFEAGWYLDQVKIEVDTTTYALPYLENFEDGAEDWYTTVGGFSVGTPMYAYGPSSAYEQTKCAGTNLAGYYPNNANTRLLSPTIPLPTLSGNEKIKLGFYQWFKTYDAADYGDVEVSVNGGSWQKINLDSFTRESGGWTHYRADLSAHAGSNIQIAFHFRSNSGGNFEAGWYLDQVKIEVDTTTYALPYLEDFEDDAEDWYATVGGFSVGTPMYAFGPSSAYEQTNCAGTNLTGDYPGNANTRLISPTIPLPTLSGNEKIKLGFYQWFNTYEAADYGDVEVSVNGGSWQTINLDSFTWESGGWTHYRADLSAHAGSNIQIAFHFRSNSGGNFEAGWYLDQVKIEVDTTTYALPYLEDFEDSAEDWYATVGGFSVGTPMYAFGPSSAYEQTKCAGTNLKDDYPRNANTRLLSPTIPLPTLSGNEKIKLGFYQWFNTHDAADYGDVEVSVNGGSWQKINLDSFTWESGGWTHYRADLSAHAGSNIQIAFHFRSNSGGNFEAGWYLDQVKIELDTTTYALPYLENFEDGAEDWYATIGGFSVGTPMYAFGPSSAYEQTGCAGTNLKDDYPRNANTRLISPTIPLPTLSGNEKIKLGFYQWFKTYEAADYGDVEVSVNGGSWQKINLDSFTRESGGWTHYRADLSAHAGSNIQIAFHFRSNSGGNFEAGWYLDQVKIELDTTTYALPYLEDFEDGAEDWYAGRGVWQVGAPAYFSGPSAAHSPTKCIGTVLNGTYPNNAHSRFISPDFFLDADTLNNSPRLVFWHWHKIAVGDTGRVQISLDGGPWQTISPTYTGNKANWSPDSVSLTPYVGHDIRIAFLFESNTGGADAGWYVDDLDFQGICQSSVAAISGNPVICSGQSTTLTATGGATYAWSTGATTAAITVDVPDAYSVTVTSAAGCTATGSAVVTAASSPIAVAGSDTSICQVQSIVLTASGGETYHWSTGATTAGILISPGSSSTYSVTVTNASGCSDVDEVSVVVNIIALTGNVSPANACQGTARVLSVTPVSGLAPYQYEWTQGLSNEPMQTVSPSSSTTYQVTVTDAGNCTATTSLSVPVWSNPIAASSNSPVCPFAPVTLSLSYPLISGQWSTGATSQSIVASAASNTVFTVNGVDANSCAVADTFLLQVFNIPPLGAFGSRSPLDSSINVLPKPTHFSWSPVVNADQYELFVWKSNESRSASETVANLQSFQADVLLAYNTPYNWQLKAIKSCQEIWSDTLTFMTSDLPDLTLPAFTTPMASDYGQTISLSWVVKNTGNAGTGAATWKDNVWLSADTIVGGADVYWALSAMSAISIPAPPTRRPGILYCLWVHSACTIYW
ncbi:MAG: choice-of-anchor J domain-containing protein [Lewinellaceae bacterium]|nr:choice-of-anchor J domain-containing protein [Lewinellaceae bacterium]